MSFRRPARWSRLGGTQDPSPAHTGTKGMDRGRRIGITLAAAMYRMRVDGMVKVPAAGGALVVANHQNFMDGPVLFGLMPRRVSVLIKAEAVKGPLGWLLRNVGQYSIDRESPSRDVLLAAMAQLKSGGAIGLFPEGTRGDGNVEQIQAGAGWLAARSGAAVVPVAIRGVAKPVDRTRRRFRPVVHVWVGEPFTVPQGAGKAAVSAASEQIRERLAATVQQLDREIDRQKEPA